MKAIRKKRVAAKPSRKPARQPERGDAYPIDAAWKDEIRKIMTERGLSQAKLAAQIGAVPSAITFLFTQATSSAMVPAIHEALGLIPPVHPGATQAIRAA